MAETAILGLVILALLVERFLSERAHAREIGTLTNAVIAKNAGEKRMLDEFWVDQGPKEAPYAPPQPVIPDGFEGQAGLGG